jgi:molybdopterin synthase catalytic subunit
MISAVKAHPNISKAGMILCHNGIVRGSDRTGGKRLSALKVVVKRSEIDRIRSWAESQTGIVAVAINALEGEFQVGDDVLYVVVAGDIREHVFSVMREAVERIKAEGVSKTAFY